MQIHDPDDSTTSVTEGHAPNSHFSRKQFSSPDLNCRLKNLDSPQNFRFQLISWCNVEKKEPLGNGRGMIDLPGSN